MNLKIISLTGQLSRRTRKLIESLPTGVRVEIECLKDHACGSNFTHVILDEIEELDGPVYTFFETAGSTRRTRS